MADGTLVLFTVDIPHPGVPQYAAYDDTFYYGYLSDGPIKFADYDAMRRHEVRYGVQVLKDGKLTVRSNVAAPSGRYDMSPSNLEFVDIPSYKNEASWNAFCVDLFSKLSRGYVIAPEQPASVKGRAVQLVKASALLARPPAGTNRLSKQQWSTLLQRVGDLLREYVDVEA